MATKKIIHLSEPITKKDTSYLENGNLEVGVSSMQGWRVTMEDSHTVLLSLPGDEKSSFFGVFDGHSGKTVAEYAGKFLSEKIVSQDSYRKGNIKDSFKRGFLELDEIMHKNEDIFNCGSTGGNVGDSRAIAYVDGRVRPLSKDHKPTDFLESMRIGTAGGYIKNGRVNGRLAVSRGFGDFRLKSDKHKAPCEQIITAVPDVTIFPLSNQWKFLLLACDGIWDVMSNQEVATYVNLKLDYNEPITEICEDLITMCLSPDNATGRYGTDNMTVMIIKFKNNTKNDEETDKENKNSNIVPV